MVSDLDEPIKMRLKATGFRLQQDKDLMPVA
jgi:hypothetical protein